VRKEKLSLRDAFADFSFGLPGFDASILGSNLYPWQISTVKTIVENNALFLLSQ
jgi:hypothetical protein